MRTRRRRGEAAFPRAHDHGRNATTPPALGLLLLPGHTPGHQGLQLRLPHAGVVLLSGDLYHSREARRLRRVPRVNTDRAATLASMDRFETIAARTHARVVIQHDPRDIAALPHFPACLH